MDKRERAMNAAIKEAYLRQHGALRGGKQYSIDEQYQLIFQRGFDAGHAAADDWVAIEDGLPERSKNVPSMTPAVWITVMPFDESPYVVKGFYHESIGWCYVRQNSHGEETGGKKLPNGSRVIAWQIIPEPIGEPKPYQRPIDEEKNK